MKSFGGPVLFLDRSNINTDEIIPAKYLTEVDKEALKPHLLEDLKIEGFDPHSEATQQARVIITRANFGCGSSREHAPWALEVNEIATVIAESHARIFRQNMFNCGMLAVELSEEKINKLFTFANRNEPACQIDLDDGSLTLTAAGEFVHTEPLPLGEFDKELVRAGGWVEYADARY